MHDLQASRGASLSPTDGAAATGPVRVRFFVVVAVVVVVIDQITKALAVEHLRDEAPIPLIPNVLSLTFLRNPGAAFGMGTSATVVLSLIAIAVCVAVVRVAPRLRDLTWTLGLALLLGGALGNLLDRIFRPPAVLRGHVVDFINYNNWFVGNIADIALTAAAVVILVRSWQGVRIDGTRETPDAPSQPSGPGSTPESSTESSSES